MPGPAGAPAAEPGLVGFLVGGAVPALAASGAWFVGVPVVTVIAAVGIPIGAVLGAAGGRRLAGPDWIAAAVGLGVLAPLLPGVLIGVVFLAGALGAAGEGGGLAAAGGLYLAAISVGAAELIAAPITVPVALVAGFLIRRTARMPRTPAMRHLALLVATAVVAGIVTTVLASANGPAPDALRVLPPG